MLKVFRENLKYLSWVLWIVIAVFILFVFVDFGATVPGGGSAPGEAAATVGRHKVTYAEFERTYRQTEDFYRQTYGEQFNRELAQQIGLPIQVLDGLIADKILLAEADRMGLRVTDEEVARYIGGLPAFQLPDGRFVGEERYRQVLRANSFTVDQFEESVRIQLLNDKVRAVLSDNLFVPDEEVARAYRDRVETASIRYLRLPSDRLRDEIVFSDEDLQTYFDSHGEDFRIPERRVVDYLLIEAEAFRPTINLDIGEIRGYYDANPDEFTQQEEVRARHILLKVSDDEAAPEVEQKMEQIRARIEAGEAFAAVARDTSEDPGSKDQGGDLGFFGRGQMIAGFEEAAFAAQPGELIGPIRTAFGYHLIEIQEKRPSGQQPFEEVEGDIRNRLLNERVRTASEARAKDLAMRIEKEDLDSADELRALAESEAGLTFHTTPAFGREENVPGIGRATAFTVAAFELQQGKVSTAIQVARGWTILRVAEIQQPRIPELAEIRERVEDALLDERQIDLAKERLGAARRDLEDEKPLEAIAVELGLEIEESGEFGRLGPIPGLGSNPKVNAAALELEEGEIGGPIVAIRDVLLFQVTQRQHYDPEGFAQQKEETRESLRSERLGQMLTALLTKRREELGVRYDTQLLRNFDLVPGES